LISGVKSGAIFNLKACCNHATPTFLEN